MPSLIIVFLLIRAEKHFVITQQSAQIMMNLMLNLKVAERKHQYQGAAYGTYGWSGESSKIINDGLLKAGVNVVLDNLSVHLKPRDEDKKMCIEFGKSFAKVLKKGQNTDKL